MSFELFSGQTVKQIPDNYEEEDTRNWIQKVIDPKNNKAKKNELNPYGWEVIRNKNTIQTRQEVNEKLTGASALG